MPYVVQTGDPKAQALGQVTGRLAGRARQIGEAMDRRKARKLQQDLLDVRKQAIQGEQAQQRAEELEAQNERLRHATGEAWKESWRGSSLVPEQRASEGQIAGAVLDSEQFGPPPPPPPSRASPSSRRRLQAFDAAARQRRGEALQIAAGMGPTERRHFLAGVAEQETEEREKLQAQLLIGAWGDFQRDANRIGVGEAYQERVQQAMEGLEAGRLDPKEAEQRLWKMQGELAEDLSDAADRDDALAHVEEAIGRTMDPGIRGDLRRLQARLETGLITAKEAAEDADDMVKGRTGRRFHVPGFDQPFYIRSGLLKGRGHDIRQMDPGAKAEANMIGRAIAVKDPDWSDLGREEQRDRISEYAQEVAESGGWTVPVGFRWRTGTPDGQVAKTWESYTPAVQEGFVREAEALADKGGTLQEWQALSARWGVSQESIPPQVRAKLARAGQKRPSVEEAARARLVALKEGKTPPDVHRFGPDFAREVEEAARRMAEDTQKRRQRQEVDAELRARGLERGPGGAAVPSPEAQRVLEMLRGGGGE